MITVGDLIIYVLSAAALIIFAVSETHVRRKLCDLDGYCGMIENKKIRRSGLYYLFDETSKDGQKRRNLK